MVEELHRIPVVQWRVTLDADMIGPYDDGGQLAILQAEEFADDYVLPAEWESREVVTVRTESQRVYIVTRTPIFG